MTNSTKLISVAVVALVVGVVLGLQFAPKQETVGAVSATGTTNTTAKVFSKVMSLSSSSATTTSIYNGTGIDYAVKDSFAFCNTVATSKTAYTGAGLANLIITGATTSSAISSNLADANTNYGTNLTIGTSTVDSYASSTAETTPNGTGRIFPSGTYYTFSSNATNTASCTVGVDVMAL